MAVNLGGKVTKLEFVERGFKALLMGNDVRDLLYRTGVEIANDAGPGFAPHPFYGQRAGRVMVTVDAETDEARALEATEKTLTRAALKRREI